MSARQFYYFYASLIGMYKSKALQILRSLDRKELDRFKDFANSPYCNSNSVVTQLLHYLLPYSPDFKHPNIEKKKAYKTLYPNKKYNEAYLRKQLSGLYQLGKEFLIYEKVGQARFFRNSALLNQLQQRQLDNIFHVQFAQCAELLEEEAIKDSTYYFGAFQLAKEAKSFFEKHDTEDSRHSLQAKADNLDIFYLVNKLRASCEMLLEAKKGQNHFRFNLTQEVIQFLEKSNHSFLQIPVIKIYWTILNTLTNGENERNYNILKQLLQQHFEAFSKAEALEMFRYAQHYCLQQINKGQHKYLEELFELLQFQLESGIKIKNGYLPLEDFKSMVALGLRQGNFDWVKNFLKTYKGKLNPEVAKDASVFYTATYHHAKADTKSLIRLLKDYRFENIYYTINARFLLLKTYLKLEQERALLDEIHAFRLLLMRSKVITTQEKKGIQNCLKILKRILRLKSDQKSKESRQYAERWEKIQHQVNNTQPLHNRNWLNEILEKIQQS